MNTNEIGNIGELKAMTKFAELMIPIYVPFGNNAKVDLIADFHGKLNKIQVKTSSRIENGSMIFNVYSVVNGKKIFYTANEVDFFIFYHSLKNILMIVPFEQINTREFRVRFEPSKNNQIKGMRFFEDYLFEDYFNNTED